ncbi:hypothetical protein FBU30_005954 [Linnemannia zychae]|nr:hypothetical protein FBU30_005954 [Linnemannia zychae]
MFVNPGRSHSVNPSQNEDDTLWETPTSDSNNNSRPGSPSLVPNKDNSNTATTKKGTVTAEGGATAPPKRIRISIACVSCRHKKIKCNGQVPCSHCIKSAGKCVYPAATKPINHQYVETLENRLKSVELHLQELLAKGGGGPSGSDRSDHQQQQQQNSGLTDIQSKQFSSTHHATSHYTPLVAKPSTSSSPPIQRRPINRSNSLLDLTSKLTGNANPTVDLLSSLCNNVKNNNAPAVDNGPMKVLEILMGNLRIERDGTAKFLPGLMQPQEESYERARTYSSKSGPPSLSPITDIPVLDWESIELPKPYTLPTTLLSPKAINTLIDLYFKSVHTFLPILHKPSFLTLCQEGEFRVPPFLLMAMCAVASCHASEVELEEISRVDGFKSHHFLFDYARSLMDTYLDVPRLSTLQGLLLLTYYQIKTMRTGQYFRVRSYLGLAVHMALDMGLARDFYVNIEEQESTSIFDGALGQSKQISTTITSSILTQQRNASSHDEQKSKEERARWMITQQERLLTWLGCYFLDGVISSLTGQDYCVAHGQLETRKLIRAANSTTDTAQAATLIFWFVHLDLVKQRRRISEMYRVLTLQPHLNQDNTVILSIAESTEMQSIEHALDNWLSTLPVHLVYPEQTPVSATDTNLPSYYTLYLHRFYYSHELLLYRPLISLSSYRGGFSDPKSPLSKCANAAARLTEIGEVIFQNYRWPWPGCGLFCYHMIQAIEIHVIMMINHSKTDSQELFYKTMGLLKGFVSLAKLPELEKAILSMEQMIAGYILNPESVSSFRTTCNSDGDNGSIAGLVLQNYHQTHQNHDSIRQLSGQRNLEQASVTTDYRSLDPMSMSPLAPAISQLMQQHLHMDSQQHQHQQRSHLNSPLIDNNIDCTKNNHIYSPIPTNVTYSSLAGAANSIADSMGVGLLQSNHTGQSYGLNSALSSCDARPHSSPISSFLYNMDTPTSMSLYSHSAQDIMPYTDYLTPSGPVEELVGFESMTTTALDIDSSSSGVRPTMALPSATSPSTATLGAIATDTRAFETGAQDSQRVTFLAPPKPAKRIHHQFTGSTNSSSKSQSQKPPVPKKPSRLMSTIGGNASWISPSTPYPSSHNPPYNDNPTSSYRINNNDTQYMSDSQGERPIPTDSTPLLMGQPTPPATRRLLRVLPAQTQLYGLGALQSSLNRDGTGKNGTRHREGDDMTDEINAEQYAIDIMSDPHLSNKVMHRRPQVL